MMEKTATFLGTPSMLNQPTDAQSPSATDGGTAAGTAVDKHAEAMRLRAELDAGLRARHACISPKFLYDALGSKLFEAICELPEYYPTRTEASIFERHG